MSILFFDTETTGLPRRNVSQIHPSQPMPVQLGWKLDDDDRTERSAGNILIYPAGGWKIEPGASAITGIDDRMIEKFGIGFIGAMDVFLDLVEISDRIVAHNAPFDCLVMRRAAAALAEHNNHQFTDPFEKKDVFCTMRAATPIVQARPKRNGEWKWPKLVECTRYFFNEEVENAHDALSDVKATARVYYELLDKYCD